MPAAHFDPLYLIIMGVAMVASHLVGLTLRRKMARYAQVPLPVTGAAVATQMLADHDLQSVQVISVPGQLTDHYNPGPRTVNLSEPVYATCPQGVSRAKDAFRNGSRGTPASMRRKPRCGQGLTPRPLPRRETAGSLQRLVRPARQHG